jgi:hypothetical protein
VRVVAANFVKIRPFKSACAASGLSGENMRTLCGSVGNAACLVFAAAIVGNFELYALATSLWMYLGSFHGIGTDYIQRTKVMSLVFPECGVVCEYCQCSNVQLVRNRHGRHFVIGVRRVN